MAIQEIQQSLPPRSCQSCTLCCRLPEIDALSKPANDWCAHCVAGRGCAIYVDRPQLCRDFLCLWMTKPDLPEEFDPLTSHMMIYEQGAQVTVLVDPDFPDAWRAEPHHGRLRQWAAAVEPKGGYVIVFVGDEVYKVRPALPQATAD